ncbi:MAG: hypothetical protein LRS49_05405 [Desulfurococcales archaeon]|nr:hypothetical protein [Desulfurococcales archaeon]
MNNPDPNLFSGTCYVDNLFIELIGEVDGSSGTPNGNEAVLAFRLTNYGWRAEFWTYRADGTTYAIITALHVNTPTSNFLYIKLNDDGTITYFAYTTEGNGDFAYGTDRSRDYGDWINDIYVRVYSLCEDMSDYPSGASVQFHDYKIYSDGSWQTPPNICEVYNDMVHEGWGSSCHPASSTLTITK